MKFKGPTKRGEWLSTKDIDTVMSFHEAPNFTYLGTLPLDFKQYRPELFKLKLKNNHLYGIIFNTDKSTGPGEHWVAAVLSTLHGLRELCYFDSLGMDPKPEIEKWLNVMKRKNKMDYYESDMTMQRQDGTCGLYAMFFIIHKLESKSTCNEFFSRRTSDKRMETFRCKLYK